MAQACANGKFWILLHIYLNREPTGLPVEMVSNIWGRKKSRYFSGIHGMGEGGLSRQNEATLWLGTAGLRGGGDEFSHAPPSDLTLLKIIV